MDIQQALRLITDSELSDRSDIADAIRGIVGERDSLNDRLSRVDSNNKDLLKQLNNARNDLKTLRSQLSDTLEISADEIATSGEALTKKLEQIKGLETKIEELESEKAELEKGKAELEDQVKDKDRLLTYQEAAQKLGADYQALSKLLDVDPENLLISEDGVKVRTKDGDKEVEQEFAAYAKTQGEWFERALFPNGLGDGDSETATTSETTTTSGGGPKAPPGGKKKQSSASKEYLKRQKFGLVRPNTQVE